ncbi:MAG: hypothetical protein EPN88_12890 [Bacteroidetes bacterium]|nr:MAG: hypothetical protein EPN88_12890 [Bacteroidota bacterium]
MNYALIDESGRIYDPNDKILVFAVVIADNLSGLEKIIIRARQRVPKKGKRRMERLSEIKFSLTGDNTRFFILKELAKYQVKIYSLIIDKQGRKIQDNPENYAFLIEEILKTPIRDNPNLTHILIDRHFTFITQREKFNLYMQKRYGNKLFIEHVDSLQNPVITIADFVAGAVRVAYTKKILRFKECIEKFVMEEKIHTWREIKKR